MLYYIGTVLLMNPHELSSHVDFSKYIIVPKYSKKEAEEARVSGCKAVLTEGEIEGEEDEELVKSCKSPLGKRPDL